MAYHYTDPRRESEPQPAPFRVARWDKDGAWHVAYLHVPTSEEREWFPVSYPPGDSGPFYKWSGLSYETESEAIAAARESCK